MSKKLPGDIKEFDFKTQGKNSQINSESTFSFPKQKIKINQEMLEQSYNKITHRYLHY